MKKFLALVMAMMMILAMGTVAFADEVDYGSTAKTSFTQIYKEYTSEVGVSETLTFTSTPDEDNPATDNLEVDSLVVTNAKTGDTKMGITVNIPSYNKVGVYKYIISEDEGNTAGVEYTDSTIRVAVMVEYDNKNNKLVIGNVSSYILLKDGTKVDTFTNNYSDLGKFTVAKKVQGNMASKNDKFEIVVKLTKPDNKAIGAPIKVGGVEVPVSKWENGVYTKTLSLSENDREITFEFIPAGVTVEVTETQTTDKMNGYKYIGTTVDGEELKTTKLEVKKGTDSKIVVTNEKKDSVETGISMDNAPYMMIMALVVLAGAAMLLKKRAYND